MEIRRTVKIKLHLSPKERGLLEETIEQFKHACQTVVDEGWNKHGLKTYDQRKLHDQTYDHLREETDLPSQLIIRARARAAHTIKSCVSFLKMGWKASKPEFTSDSIAYDERTMTIWEEKRKCSLSTVDGRIHADFILPDDPEKSDYYGQYLNREWEVTQSTVEKHTNEEGKPFYLHLRLKREERGIREKPSPTVMGIDLGIENLAVTSTGRFFSGGELFHSQKRFEEIRGKLQAKGTRSAHRTVQDMSGRENRFACDTLHKISKRIVEEAVEHDVDVIAFEDLKYIRENLPNKKRFHAWAFKKLYEFVKYKAEAKRIKVVQVDPEYTSQRCSKCGFTVSANRNVGERRFKCQKCGYELHDDYNAAKNIGLRYLLAGQKSPSRTGHGQLALKSGVVTLNGKYFPAQAG